MMEKQGLTIHYDMGKDNKGSYPNQTVTDIKMVELNPGYSIPVGKWNDMVVFSWGLDCNAWFVY